MFPSKTLFETNYYVKIDFIQFVALIFFKQLSCHFKSNCKLFITSSLLVIYHIHMDTNSNKVSWADWDLYR